MVPLTEETNKISGIAMVLVGLSANGIRILDQPCGARVLNRTITSYDFSALILSQDCGDRLFQLVTDGPARSIYLPCKSLMSPYPWVFGREYFRRAMVFETSHCFGSFEVVLV